MCLKVGLEELDSLVEALLLAGLDLYKSGPISESVTSQRVRTHLSLRQVTANGEPVVATCRERQNLDWPQKTGAANRGSRCACLRGASSGQFYPAWIWYTMRRTKLAVSEDLVGRVGGSRGELHTTTD